jgi:predicted nucleic acid-binding Zn ribbon protein
MTVVFRHWEAAVGSAIAEHAQPLSLRESVLVVGVDQPAWATQLRFLTPEILSRLEEAAGRPVAERIEVRIRPFKGP